MVSPGAVSAGRLSGKAHGGVACQEASVLRVEAVCEVVCRAAPHHVFGGWDGLHDERQPNHSTQNETANDVGSGVLVVNDAGHAREPGKHDQDEDPVDSQGLTEVLEERAGATAALDDL